MMFRRFYFAKRVSPHAVTSHEVSAAQGFFGSDNDWQSSWSLVNFVASSVTKLNEFSIEKSKWKQMTLLPSIDTSENNTLTAVCISTFLVIFFLLVRCQASLSP